MKRRKWLLLLTVWTMLSAVGCDRGPYSSGDRVLVSKCMYDTEISKPQRFDVVVFKYPVRPIERGVPKNYIKRLLGLPGEILAILFGRIFVLSPEGDDVFFPEPQVLTTKGGNTYKGFVVEQDEKKIVFQSFTFATHYSSAEIDRSEIQSLTPIDVSERWKHRPPLTREELERRDWIKPAEESYHRTVDDTDIFNDFDFLFEDHPRSWGLFKAGRFTMLRKPPDVMLAMRRIVYDNDFQPKDLTEPRFQRWPTKDSGWKSDGGAGFVAGPKNANEIDWLRYQHLVVEGKAGAPRNVAAPTPQFISDHYGYNSAVTLGPGGFRANHWVGDLMLECTLEVTEPKGEFWMELSRGSDRFRARFDLATGQCTLFREGKGHAPIELAARDTRVKAKGTYNLRFANFCSRLTVWVDRDLPFDHGHDYDPPDLPRAGEFKAWAAKHPDAEDPDKQFMDLIVSRSGPTENDKEPASVGVRGAAVQINHLRVWRDTYYAQSDRHGGDGKPNFFYVQPGHYMCLGDNSTMSSDSREWGLVPNRLMLGRAHAVYFPFGRAGPIR